MKVKVCQQAEYALQIEDTRGQTYVRIYEEALKRTLTKTDINGIKSRFGKDRDVTECMLTVERNGFYSDPSSTYICPVIPRCLSALCPGTLTCTREETHLYLEGGYAGS